MSTGKLNELSFSIHGMSCGGCAAHVEQALSDLPGVRKVKIDLAANQANVSYDPNQADLVDFHQAVDAAGYTIPTTQFEFSVTGMTCMPCAARVQGALGDLPGVVDVLVHLSKGTAQVTYVSGLVTAGEMSQAIEGAGYQAVDLQEPSTSIPLPTSVHKQTVRQESRGIPWPFKKLLGRS